VVDAPLDVCHKSRFVDRDGSPGGGVRAAVDAVGAGEGGLNVYVGVWGGNRLMVSVVVDVVALWCTVVEMLRVRGQVSEANYTCYSVVESRAMCRE
jgi:hypothetical protein